MKYLNYINLISDGTRINDNKYLESLVTTTELIACIEEQIQKMLIYYFIMNKNIFTFQKHLLSFQLQIFYIISAFWLAVGIKLFTNKENQMTAVNFSRIS